MNHDGCVLSVEDFSVSFSQYCGGVRQRLVTPIKSLNVEVKAGEVHALIGASGSGKSLLAHAVLGILPGNASWRGHMEYRGIPLTERLKQEKRGKEIVFIPQSVNCLDPLMRVGRQITIGLPKDWQKNASKIESSLLKKYGLGPEVGKKYPFQLSGGMLRRILFATCVRPGVKLVIADEPTPGVHQEALRMIMDQLKAFADSGAAVLLITHDIISALTVSDRVTVLREGTSVGTAAASDFNGSGEGLPHPYIRALWRSLPENDFFMYSEVYEWR